MAQFNEYPKLMKHPMHAPAQWKKLEGKGVGLFEPDTVMTSPERFPDVTVNTLDQEKYYAARGYRPNNLGDPQQYEQTLLESAPVAGYQYNEYPKWKYHAVELPRIVQTQAEELDLGDGWADTPVIATEDDLEETQSPSATVDPVPAAPVQAVVAEKAAQKTTKARKSTRRGKAA